MTTLDTLYENRTEELAAKSHTQWLNKRQIITKEPRHKVVDGEKINIAVPWPKLHPAWKQQQLVLAQDYVDALYDTRDIEESAAAVHRVWMEQNKASQDDPNQQHLFVSYDDLPEFEKEKDRQVARIILNLH